MLLLLTGLFVVIALVGMALATRGIRNRHIPFGWLHGIAATLVLVGLFFHIVHAPHNLLVNSAAVLLLLTATGGLLLLLFRLLRQALPGIVVGLHAMFALAAIVLLALAVVRR